MITLTLINMKLKAMVSASGMSLVSAFLLVLFSLVYPSYSNAYTQQYTVGGTGPSGGTVTGVTVTETLSGTETIVYGDTMETVNTYTYTETVTEDVAGTVTTTTTTPVTTSYTSANIISPGVYKQHDNVGSGIRSYNCADSTNGFNCHQYTYVWGSVSWGSTGTLDSFVGEGGSLTGVTAGADVKAYYNGCCNYDQFYIKIALTNTSTGNTISWQSNTWNVTSTDYTAYSYSVPQSGLDQLSNTIGANSDFSNISARAYFYGYDVGYWAGQYGPIMRDPYLTASYDVTQFVVNQITQEVINSIQTVLSTTEEETITSYNPSSTTDTSTSSMTIEVQGSGGSGTETVSTFSANITDNGDGTASVTMTTSPGGSDSDSGSTQTLGTFTVNTTPSEPKVESQMEPMQTASVDSPKESSEASAATAEIKSAGSEPKAEAKTEAKTESKSESKSESKTAENKSDSKSDSNSESKSESDKKEAKEAIAQQIMTDLMSKANESFGQADTTRLAVMVALASDPTKDQANLSDASQWYESKDIYNMDTLKDPYSVLFNQAQDIIHERMIDMQYRR